MADNKTHDEKDGKVEESDLERKADLVKNEASESPPISEINDEIPSVSQAADGSEYESAEEGKSSEKIVSEENPKLEQEPFPASVDEEGGNEGIAEPSDADQDILDFCPGEDKGGGIPETQECVCVADIKNIPEAADNDQNDLNVAQDSVDLTPTSKCSTDAANIETKLQNTEEPDPSSKDKESNVSEDEGREYNDCEEESGDDDGDYKADDDDADCEDEEYIEEEDGECNVEEGDDEEESDNSVEEERQQGDGEECSPESVAIEKELDFDEDRRNPQYIPKKGIFYEHDDRNVEEVKEQEKEPARDHKKKLWLDEGRWGHDRFKLEEQFPKSKHELIATYGYDIRNEDGPPRARRRRRYGRGPTKYDRNWEDETAYSREKLRSGELPQGGPRGRRSRGPRIRGAPRFRGQGRRDFDSRKQDDEDLIENEQENESFGLQVKEPEFTVPVINSKEFPALPMKDSKPQAEVFMEKRPFFQKSASEVPESTSVKTLTFENSNLSGRNSIERDVPSPRRGKTAPFGSHQPSGDHFNRGNRRPVPQGGRTAGRGDNMRRGRGSNMRHISPRFLENKVNNLKLQMDNMTISDSNNVGNSLNLDGVGHIDNSDLTNVASDSDLPSMALKGAGDSAGRPKRYSSLRQRSLPETNSYQSTQQAVPTQHGQYYEAGYQPTLYASTDSGVPPSSSQSQSATSPPLLNAAYQSFAPTPYTENYGIRMPVNQPPPRLFAQATVPTAQPLLAAPPPPCLPPPNANMINFAPPPPSGAFAPQFTYQQYAPPAPAPQPAPPNELYQPGITYYYPHTQATPIRPTVQKRPKAAIPILPPPDRETKRKEKESSNRKPLNDAVNSEVPSIRTESSSQSQSLPSVGVES